MYQSIQLNLTDSQYKNLSQGKSVNVSKNSVGSGHTVFLTQRQINKIQKNLKIGKGTRISLSQDQMDYNVQHGSGFKDWIKKGWNAVKDPAKNLGKMLANNYGDQAVKLASNMANNLLDQGTLVASAMAPQKGLLGKIAQDTIKMGNNASQGQLLAILKGLKQTVNGSGLFEFTPEANQHIDTLKGQGFFDDVFDVVSTPFKAVANNVLPIASNVAEKALSGLLTKALTGGGTRPRGRPKKGKGIFSDLKNSYDNFIQAEKQAILNPPTIGSNGYIIEEAPDGSLRARMTGKGLIPPGARISGKGLLPPGAHVASTN